MTDKLEERKKYSVTPLLDLLIAPKVKDALKEDLGRRGDITTYATIGLEVEAKLKVVAREAGVIAGMDLARLAFHIVDEKSQFTPWVMDGTFVEAGEVLAEVFGKGRSLLTAERTALNFLTHLSGIATATANVVEAVKPYGTEITCTRKTIPGMRMLQKYAVRAGGGRNHRMGLDDAILIKDNHIAIAGGIEAAIKSAREAAGHLIPIEVEVDTLAELQEALSAGATLILLDNMTITQLSEAVEMAKGYAATEASGGINPERVIEVAKTGVDYIAMGWLTHSAKALDIGLDIALE